MKRFVFILFLIHKVFAQNQSLDIISYDIQGNYDSEKRFLKISANLKIHKDINSGPVKLLFSPYAFLKSITVGAITAKSNRQTIDNDTLFIEIPASHHNETTLNMRFDYTLPADSFTFGNVIMLRREIRWYPLQYNDISNMMLNIVVPDEYIVLSMGELIDKKRSGNNNEYKYGINNYSTFGIVIGRKKTWNITSKTINGTRINFYFNNSDTAAIGSIIDETFSSFSFFDKEIGPYSRSELNLVEIPDDRVQLVQSLSSMIVMGRPFITYYHYGWGGWTPHEVAHQWWGAGLFTIVDAKASWFLGESITEYLKVLYIQNAEGSDSLNKLLTNYLERYNSIDKSKELPLIKISRFQTNEDGTIVYTKGTLVVHKLKNLMGDEMWRKFIQEIYKNYYGSFLRYEDFIRILSKYDSNGMILNTLNKWLSETGHLE